MNKVILLRFGELYLKGHNRSMFEKALISNIKSALKGFSFRFEKTTGRYVLHDYDIEKESQILKVLQRVFGLVSLSVADEINTDRTLIEARLKELAKTLEKDFRVTVKRADKTFPINSDDYSAILGEVILNANPKLKVNLKSQLNNIKVEIRENKKTYIYQGKIMCNGGMPVGTAGKGLVMLSGGIDSPVAAYMIAKRGLKLEAIHFHSFPYTSKQAKEKVIKLAELLVPYTTSIRLHIIPFTKIQEAIHVNCHEEYMITIMRRIMLRIAERVANNVGAGAVITGESLGQVASQTMESITVTNSVMEKLPVFRPLIAMDKQEIMDIAQKIGTYETSILPYEDCCTVFLPKNPVIKPTVEKAEKEEEALNLGFLISQAIQDEEVIEL